MNLHDLQPQLPTELAPGVHVRIRPGEPFMEEVWNATGRVTRPTFGGTMWRIRPDVITEEMRDLDVTFITAYDHEVEIIP